MFIKTAHLSTEAIMRRTIISLCVSSPDAQPSVEIPHIEVSECSTNTNHPSAAASDDIELKDTAKDNQIGACSKSDKNQVCDSTKNDNDDACTSCNSVRANRRPSNPPKMHRCGYGLSTNENGASVVRKSSNISDTSSVDVCGVSGGSSSIAIEGSGAATHDDASNNSVFSDDAAGAHCGGSAGAALGASGVEVQVDGERHHLISGELRDTNSGTSGTSLRLERDSDAVQQSGSSCKHGGLYDPFWDSQAEVTEVSGGGAASNHGDEARGAASDGGGAAEEQQAPPPGDVSSSSAAACSVDDISGSADVKELSGGTEGGLQPDVAVYEDREVRVGRS